MSSHTHSDLKHIDELNSSLLREIDKFFINYHGVYGEKFKVVGHCGPQEAMKLVKKSMKRNKAA